MSQEASSTQIIKLLFLITVYTYMTRNVKLSKKSLCEFVQVEMSKNDLFSLYIMFTKAVEKGRDV